MKANELRIGNYVLCSNMLWHKYLNGKTLKVEGVRQIVRHKSQEIDYSVTLIDESNYNQDYNQFSEFVEPIPLTEEWLLKFGFKQDSNLKNSLCKHGIWFNKTNMEATYLSQKLMKINYVHQLQNLFWCLTGEELNIVL